MKNLSAIQLLTQILNHRFLKFGIVGMSGVFVNLAVLYLCQEHIFSNIQSPKMRLDISLATAIFFATVSNFIWNRAWTWGDRKRNWNKHIFFQFCQYAFACWIGIVLQLIFTKLFAIYLHYLIANLIAILLASFVNFIVNSFWTFPKQHKAVLD